MKSAYFKPLVIMICWMSLPANAGGGGNQSDARQWCEKHCSGDPFEDEGCWGCFQLEQVGCTWSENFPGGVFDFHVVVPTVGSNTGELIKCDKWEHVDYGYVCDIHTVVSWSPIRLDRLTLVGTTGLIRGQSVRDSSVQFVISLTRDPHGDAVYKGKRNYQAAVLMEMDGRRESFIGTCGAYYKNQLFGLDGATTLN